MPNVQVTWPGNADGAEKPIVVRGRAAFDVHLKNFVSGTARVELSEPRRPGRRAEWTVLEPEDESEGVYSYELELQRTLHPRPAVLRVVVVDDEGVSVEHARVLVLSGREHDLAAGAALVLVLAFVYLLVIFPQLDDLVGYLQALQSPPVLIGVLGAGATLLPWLSARLSRPDVALPLGAVALGLAVWVSCKAVRVENWALERVCVGSANGASLELGESRVLWGFEVEDFVACAGVGGASINGGKAMAEKAGEPQKPPRFCSDKEASCALFAHATPDGEPWLQQLVQRLLTRVRVGCPGQEALSGFDEEWGASGSCHPDHILLESAGARQVEGLPAETSSAGSDGSGDATGSGGSRFVLPDELSVELQHDGSSTVARRHTDQVWSLKLCQEPSTALRVSMSGTGNWRKVVTAVSTEKLALTTLEATAGEKETTTLSFDLYQWDTKLGTYFGTVTTVSGQRSVACGMATTGTRLHALALRGQLGEAVHGTAKWSASAGDAVTEFPLCWQSAASPDYGELQLEKQWHAETGWSITLPAGSVPKKLAILDGNDTTLGFLDCDVPGAGEPGDQCDARPRVVLGPLLIQTDGVLEKKFTHKAEGEGLDYSWTPTVNGAKGADWFWGCWPEGKATPRAVSAGGRWSLTEQKTDSRTYVASANLASCLLTQHGERVLVCPGDKDPPKPEALLGGALREKWFEAELFPPECSKDKSRVCK